MKKTKFGVFVGRFQTTYIHDGHHQCLTQILNSCEDILIFVGVTEAQGSLRDPLDYETRKVMLRKYITKHFPTQTQCFTILPLKDKSIDKNWVETLDNALDVFSTNTKDFILYGGRDSYIPIYNQHNGKHTTTLLPEVKSKNDSYELSSSWLRNSIISSAPIATSEFNAGVIYGLSKMYPSVFPTVDVAVVNYNTAIPQVLLARKKGEDKWRLIGGFVDPTDASFEFAAKREVLEETGLEVGDPKYVGSYHINDWRYKGVRHQIISTLFIAPYLHGCPVAQDDIEEVRWFTFDKKKLDINLETLIVPSHLNMLLSIIEIKD